MGSGTFVVSRGKKVCMDCGKTIKKGDTYWYYTGRQKEYVYCKPCKIKPIHSRVKYDYDAICDEVFKQPLFNNEFNEKFGTTSGQATSLIRRMKMGGYPIIIFRWCVKGRTQGSKHIIIYFVEGSEDKVIKKLIENFDFDSINWKNLFNTLLGYKLPEELRDRKTIESWIHQNIFNYVANNHLLQEVIDE